MFLYDRPINNENEDFLSRTDFSKNLGESLLNWEEKESLVVAIYGEWGSGKSSIINLAKDYISKSTKEGKPTIIEFNPWMYSDLNSLTKNFFSEIGKQIKIKGDSEKDKKIAEKLSYYASMLGILPDQEKTTALGNKLLLALALLGFSFSQIFSLEFVSNKTLVWIIFGFSTLIILYEILQGLLSKLSSFFEKRSVYRAKSILEVKKELVKELEERKRKLLIIIDDIDRLNKNEIREIFRLIRSNADFPNTIYLLAFDRKIIEENLEEQPGITGKDFLEKIIQVSFNVPFAKSSKIEKYLFQELNRVLSKLPNQANDYFGENKPYWPNIFYSGFRDFFKNIRDVKRYISGLEFNISQMYPKGVLEVNPIDFIALEAIRIFVPEFYSFMRSQKELFTSTTDSRYDHKVNTRKTELESALNLCPEDYKGRFKKLIVRLFPQIGNILDHGYSSYGYTWQPVWSKDLHICSTTNYDTYFTMIPGGDESELSQFEMASILNSAENSESLETILRSYIENKKIRKVLQRVQDYTDDKQYIPDTNIKNIVQALFNISDELPTETTGMFDFGADMDVMRIIFQLLKREPDKSKNYEMLQSTIQQAKQLYGLVKKVSLESGRKENDAREDQFSVPEDKVRDLQLSALTKIKEFENRLLENKNLLYILYRWKEWDEQGLIDFVSRTLSTDEGLLNFVEHFIAFSTSLSADDLVERKTKGFNYQSLNHFSNLDNIKLKLESIKSQNSDLYKKHAETIDFFLDNFDQRNNQR